MFKDIFSLDVTHVDLFTIAVHKFTFFLQGMCIFFLHCICNDEVGSFIFVVQMPYKLIVSSLSSVVL